MRIALIISALLNVALAASVFGVWTVAPRAVNQLEDIAEREQRLSLTELSPISQGDIVLAGDDMLARGPWGDVYRHYTVFLRNRAIRGETCPRLRERMEQWLQEDNARNKGAGLGRVLVLNCGATDLIQGVDAHRTIHALATMLDMATAQSPGTRVVVLGLIPEEDIAIDELRARNHAMNETAMARNIVYLDFEPMMSGAEGALKAPFATPSGRLNGEGYRLIAEKLAPHLRP